MAFGGVCIESGAAVSECLTVAPCLPPIIHHLCHGGGYASSEAPFAIVFGTIVVVGSVLCPFARHHVRNVCLCHGPLRLAGGFAQTMLLRPCYFIGISFEEGKHVAGEVVDVEASLAVAEDGLCGVVARGDDEASVVADVEGIDHRLVQGTLDGAVDGECGVDGHVAFRTTHRALADELPGVLLGGGLVDGVGPDDGGHCKCHEKWQQQSSEVFHIIDVLVLSSTVLFVLVRSLIGFESKNPRSFRRKVSNNMPYMKTLKMVNMIKGTLYVVKYGKIVFIQQKK